MTPKALSKGIEDLGTPYRLAEIYAEQAMQAKSIKIDNTTRLIIYDRKWWCPKWLYKKVIKEHITLEISN